MYCVKEKERKDVQPIQDVNTDVINMDHPSVSHQDEGLATNLNLAKVMIDRGNAEIFNRAQEGTNKISKLKGNKLSAAINETLFTNKKLKDYAAHAIVVAELPQVEQTLYRKFFLNLNGKLSKKDLFPGVELIETPGGDVEKYKVVDENVFIDAIQKSYLNKKIYTQKGRPEIYDGASKELLEEALTERPISLHPAMKARIEAHIAENNGEFPTQAGIAGLHAEVQALNFAFHKFDELGIDRQEGLRNTYLYTKRLVGEKNADFPACYNCSGILSGTEHVMTGRIDGTNTSKLNVESSETPELLTPTQPFSLDLTADKSPEAVLENVSRLVAAAVNHPDEVAQKVKEGRVGGDLAQLTDKGGMSLVVDAYVSLIALLYRDGYLKEQDIIDLLLPARNHDSVKSLLHSLTGAAWSSDAVRKIGILLSEIAKSDAYRIEIIRRLSLSQSGYDFKNHSLLAPADFYKLAKRADKLKSNDNVKQLLNKNGLIPKDRELYKRSFGPVRENEITIEKDYASLLNTIESTIRPVTLAANNQIKKENAELDKARVNTKEALDLFNLKEKQENEDRINEMIDAFSVHTATQEALHDISRQVKQVTYSLAQEAKLQRQYEKTPSFKNSVANVPETLFVSESQKDVSEQDVSAVPESNTLTAEKMEQRVAALLQSQKMSPEGEYRIAILKSPRVPSTQVDMSAIRENIKNDELANRLLALRLPDVPSQRVSKPVEKRTLLPPLLKD